MNQRKVYQKPLFEEYGDVQTITLKDGPFASKNVGNGDTIIVGQDIITIPGSSCIECC